MAAAAAVVAATTLNKIERAHQMYREGLHEEALGFYTEALAMAKTRAQKIALHSNRAACYLKLHDFDKVSSFSALFFLCKKKNLFFWVVLVDLILLPQWLGYDSVVTLWLD